MNARATISAAMVLLAACIGCSGLTSPVKNSQSLEELAAMQLDCIQYPLNRTDTDGNELWQANWVLYTPYDLQGRIMRRSDGTPLRDLRYSKLMTELNKLGMQNDARLGLGIDAERTLQHLHADGTIQNDPSERIKNIDIQELLTTKQAADRRYIAQQARQE